MNMSKPNVLSLLTGHLMSLATENTVLNDKVTMLDERVATLETENLDLKVEVSTLKRENVDLKFKVATLETENVDLNGKVKVLEGQMNGLSSMFVMARNRQLVRQIVFAYQLRVCTKYGLLKKSTKKEYLASKTHAVISKEAKRDNEIARLFKDEVEKEFERVSSGKLNTTTQINDCLAVLRSLGTDTSHPYRMYGPNWKEVPPTVGDLQIMIGELDVEDEVVKAGALAALNILVAIAGEDSEFLKTT